MLCVLKPVHASNVVKQPIVACTHKVIDCVSMVQDYYLQWCVEVNELEKISGIYDVINKGYQLLESLVRVVVRMLFLFAGCTCTRKRTYTHACLHLLDLGGLI